MTTRVFLLRHAQTDRPDVFHGYESDAGLSDLGYRQAAAIAPIIASLKPDCIWSSGMRRARLTAEPIALACGLPLHIEPELHERKVGILVGTPNSGEIGIWPATLKEWISGNTRAAQQDAESFDAIRDRVLPAWHRIMQGLDGRSVAIVAHGIVIRVLLLSLLEGYSVADWEKVGRIQNVSISEIIGSGENWKPVRIGEVPPEVQALSKQRE